ncbi:hypothetical protein Goshw_020301 [Gossypium schwendimanii]|uniref:Beta-glucosidase n=1 Tax=Gossypium schwendimanii TaxID=34291 RepID=A0A7J9MP94_GOSSC|nr:hypothetical protein [Gossypium schwendimanii]
MDDPGNLTFPKSLYDIHRVNFYRSYLKELKRAINDGANVTGYFAWSILYNFEWLLGYTSRFGLVNVDHNDLKRYPKLSAYWKARLWSLRNFLIGNDRYINQLVSVKFALVYIQELPESVTDSDIARKSAEVKLESDTTNGAENIND